MSMTREEMAEAVHHATLVLIVAFATIKGHSPPSRLVEALHEAERFLRGSEGPVGPTNTKEATP